MKAVSLGIYLLIYGVVFAADLEAEISPPNGEHAEGITGKMKAAYAQIEDYQMETEVKVYHEGQVVETKRFLYTFRKPDHIRIDMESPYAGMVLVYPGEDHFLAGELALYHFFIDKTRWLPVEVREFTQKGILKREVRFRNLKTSIGVTESFFRINGGSPEHGQPTR